MHESLTILAIESSCDETAAAVFNTSRGLLSTALFSQISLHERFGGVIPELASRVHIQKIRPIVQEALEKAQCTLDDIDVIAVTSNPGLPGSLFIGTSFAKAMAWSKGKKIIAVNHLEGHVFSSFLENNIPFPHLCLTASGGHTSLYIVEDFGVYTPIAETLDDAAGEAFDKIAKLLHLSYPGGPVIERLARQVDFQDFFAYPRTKKTAPYFSFSGVKTAVLYDLVKRGAYILETKTLIDRSESLAQQVASSLLVCIADIFCQKLEHALTQYPHIKAITFVGGVACNKYISQRIKTVADAHGCSFAKPSPIHCTDNAAMIAFVAAYKAQRGEYSPLTFDILE